MINKTSKQVPTYTRTATAGGVAVREQALFRDVRDLPEYTLYELSRNKEHDKEEWSRQRRI